jgi:hypothetical protein
MIMFNLHFAPLICTTLKNLSLPFKSTTQAIYSLSKQLTVLPRLINVVEKSLSLILFALVDQVRRA